MNVLGIETSCDETGVALYDPARGLLAERLYSQVRLHADYGGVVPELASRDHIRRVLPLAREACAEAGLALTDLDAVAYAEGPGLAGALLVGASIGRALAYALGVPGIGIHHLEGHLLSPLLSTLRPQFPFIALLVSGGHTQLMRVNAVGDYALLGDTLDDAAGEAFDKTAQLLGLGYPGGPALAALAEQGTPGKLSLPRPMLTQLEKTGDLDFSFSGLKTAVLTLSRQTALGAQGRADLAAEFEAAVVEVLTAKCLAALGQTGLSQLVVAGGVGANRRLRAALTAAVTKRGGQVFFPPPALCTDNGAMIALAGALRLGAELPGTAGALRIQQQDSGFGIRGSTALTFGVRPRWDLASLRPIA